MSDCHLPDITRPHADGAAAAPQPRSLMLEAPPRPPSPYRPRNHRRVGQTLPDLFQAKYEAFARRQKDTMLLHQAEKESERKMELERSSRRKPMVRMLPKGTIIKRISPEEQERMDRALAEYHFHEAQRQQLVKEELEEYINMTTEEELTFTQFLVDHLQVAAEFVVHDDTSAREETRRNVVERYEGRDTMMFNIAEATARHFTEERIAKMIAEYIQYLLQQHRAGVEEIAEEEAEDLQRVLLWEEESRPIGTGIKVGTTEDPRLRHLRKKPKRVRPGKVIEKTPTELCLEKLREKSSALVVVESDANDAGVAAQEGEYLLDGRALLEQDRERQRLAILRSNALVHLHEKEQRGREEVQYEESMSWLPILLHGVDGIYEARRHTKEREAREEREEAVRAEEEEFCADIKLRILAENIEVREEDYLVEEDPVEVENARIAAAIRGRQEATNTVLFPSLNLVMDLAMKQDTLGTLHNPTFAMVSAVEREIAEEEGRPMGSVARQFQVDERDIFTPDYLVHVLWCGDLDLPNMHHHFEDLQKQEEEEEAAEMLQDFISTMLRERSLLIQEGICESWKLYNYAAEESANVSFTAAGSVFYQGVQHPDT